MLKLSTLLIFLLFSFSSYSHAGDRVCSSKDAIRAENDIPALKDWKGVYRSYKKYGHCDDGSIGEGYSDKVALLLAQEWKHLAELQAIVAKDAHFLDFVLKHIDESVDVDDLKQVFANSTKHCIRSSPPLCDAITERICRLEKEKKTFENPTLLLLTEKQLLQHCQ